MIKMQNKVENPRETILVFSGNAVRDLYFLLNQNKEQLLLSSDLNTLHRLTGAAYRDLSEGCAEEESDQEAGAAKERLKNG